MALEIVNLAGRRMEPGARVSKVNGGGVALRGGPESAAGFYSRVYDRLYRFGYHRRNGYSHASGIVARVADRRLAVGSALDIGCSHGWAVARLGELGVKAVGIDVARSAVARGVKQGLDLRVASATALPFEDGAFELVLSTDCFEHLRPEDVDAAEREAWRVATRYLAFKINPRPDGSRHWRLLAGTRLHLSVRPVRAWVEDFLRLGGRVVEFDESEEEFVIEKR